MKIIFMGRKKYAAEVLQWTVDQGIEVAFVCTDSQFSNSPTLRLANALGIPVVAMEEAEKYMESHSGDLKKKTQEIQMELYKSVLLDVVEKGILPATPQKESDGQYISRKQMNEMKKVDLNHMDHEQLELMIRAFWFSPYDGACFELNGKTYTIINRDILKLLQENETTALTCRGVKTDGPHGCGFWEAASGMVAA